MRDDEHFGGDRDISRDLADEMGRRIARYVAGECSAEEAAALEQRLATDPALAEDVQALQEVWAAAEVPRKRRDLDEAWQRLGLRLGDSLVSSPALRVVAGGKRSGGPLAVAVASTLRRAQLPPVGRVAAIAAAIIAIAAPATLVWTIAHREASPTHSPTVAQFHEYSTRNGQRAEIRLADGTRVILGVASRLRVPSDFGARVRAVTLDGQGYFDVVHDTTRPFFVRTALGTARDVGTAFVVTTYPEAGGMRVAVESGAVALAPTTRAGAERVAGARTKTVDASHARAPDIVLRRGELGQLDSAGVVRVERGIDIAAAVAWTRGELVFRRTPLREVLPQLERWYGIQVRLATPSLGEVPISASFADEPPAQTLAFIAASANARLERDATRGDSSYTIYEP
jgi:transmembrane sensor